MKYRQKKWFNALKSLKRSDKTNKLKKIECIFQKNLLNDVIIHKLQGIIKLQDIIKSIELHYESKCEKTYDFSKYALPIVFVRYLQ